MKQLTQQYFQRNKERGEKALSGNTHDTVNHSLNFANNIGVKSIVVFFSKTICHYQRETLLKKNYLILFFLLLVQYVRSPFM